jgi:hypothetical protein
MPPSALPCTKEDSEECIVIKQVFEACCNALFVKLMLPVELALSAALHREENEIF